MKVKLTIECDHEGVEMANFLLARAIESAIENPDFRKHYKIKMKGLEKAARFRKAVLKEFLKPQN